LADTNQRIIAKMQAIKSSFEILKGLDEGTLKRIESYGRTCYKSDCKLESEKTFAKALIDRQHESVIEHEIVTVRIVCDRGVSHELVRHRLASYSQESTRYCNYSKEKFGRTVTFIEPDFGDNARAMYLWRVACMASEDNYFGLLDLGVKPEIARSVLNNSLKTEIVVTMNLRSWRNFFKLRTAKSAHPQMREIAVPMLAEFKKRLPIIFDDIKEG
jgi:thymidylate synthase (FAD)